MLIEYYTITILLNRFVLSSDVQSNSRGISAVQDTIHELSAIFPDCIRWSIDRKLEKV